MISSLERNIFFALRFSGVIQGNNSFPTKNVNHYLLSSLHGSEIFKCCFVDYLCSVFMFLSETLEQAEEGRFYDTIEQPVWKSYRKSPYNILFLFFFFGKDVVLIQQEVVYVLATLKSISR